MVAADPVGRPLPSFSFWRAPPAAAAAVAGTMFVGNIQWGICDTWAHHRFTRTCQNVDVCWSAGTCPLEPLPLHRLQQLLERYRKMPAPSKADGSLPHPPSTTIHDAASLVAVCKRAHTSEQQVPQLHREAAQSMPVSL